MRQGQTSGQRTTLQTGGWQRRKHARPGEILDAAMSVFAEKGFAATRMEDIARRAGVTKGTIYLYFPGKAKLFRAMVGETVTQALKDLEERRRNFHGSSHDMLILLITAISDYLQNNARAALPKIILSECGTFPELAQFWHEDIIRRALTMVQDTIIRGIERGEFRRQDTEMAARVALSPVILFAIWRASVGRITEPEFNPRKLLSAHLDILMHGLEVPHYGIAHPEVTPG